MRRRNFTFFVGIVGLKEVVGSLVHFFLFEENLTKNQNIELI